MKSFRSYKNVCFQCHLGPKRTRKKSWSNQNWETCHEVEDERFSTTTRYPVLAPGGWNAIGEENTHDTKPVKTHPPSTKSAPVPVSKVTTSSSTSTTTTTASRVLHTDSPSIKVLPVEILDNVLSVTAILKLSESKPLLKTESMPLKRPRLFAPLIIFHLLIPWQRCSWFFHSPWGTSQYPWQELGQHLDVEIKFHLEVWCYQNICSSRNQKGLDGWILLYLHSFVTLKPPSKEVDILLHFHLNTSEFCSWLK